MHLNYKKCLGGVALFALALPTWAAHEDSTEWIVNQPATIGTTQVKPGTYEIRAEEGQSQLSVLSNGKVIAQVPCHWTQLPAKPQNSEVVMTSDKVTQVEFGGRTQAIDLSQ